MKNITAFTVGIAAVLAFSAQRSFAADEMKATAMEKMFIKKAADGGMAEVELGKMAAEKGGSQDVKDFGNRMVTDHTKINDNLKEVAGKMDVMVPTKVSAKHHMEMEKLSGLSGAEFDKTYVKAMVKDHETDLAEFQKADKTVKNPDLKKFIDDSIPVLQDHLDTIKKIEAKNQG